jgi:formate dehydrogenase major subunit
VVEIMHAAKRGEIKGMYIEGENPEMSDPDLNHAQEALVSLGHLVVLDLFMTETVFHADIALPAAALAEKSGSFTNIDRRGQLARPVVPSPGAAKQDWWIIQQLGQPLGPTWNYEGRGEIFAEMAQTMPLLRNITWDRLQREDAVTYSVDSADAHGDGIIFTNQFPTPSGRARMVPTQVLPPGELPGMDFPMVLSIGSVPEHRHTGSMTRRAEMLDAIEPEAVALLSPQELLRRNIAPGGTIRVETRPGVIEIRARADHDGPANMIFIPFCYAEAAGNPLTNPALDPIGKIPEFKFCGARIL